MKKSRILWIARTAIFIALLIALQFATAPLGQLVTGSLVNLLLIVSVMTCGLASGLCVAAISPVMAKLMGIGPLWELIPFVILGNAALVLVWHFIGNRNMGRKIVAHIAALVCAAVTKFVVLYLGIVVVAVPLFLKLPQPQVEKISGMFSLPQLFTATVGGALAVVILPVLKKAIRKGQD
ncbi:MAG: hypothetical protein LBR85_08205 [Oscillospiraceae bacterium]|nr:hypothetical protein [Oscillospiraceae bacterium]